MSTANETLAGEVLRLTYQDPVSTFTVAKLLPEEGSREVTIVGHMPLLQVGHTVRCTGRWVIDPKHGRQFSVEKMSHELPSDPSSIERLIASGFLEGIGPVFAKKIVQKFGSDTFSILDREPERLHEIQGLGKRRASQAIKCWKSRTEQQELFVLLCNWGITQTMATKILAKWGNHAIKVIKQNPFHLAKEIHGIGFHVADKIADRLGIDPSSDIRIDAALEFLLWELSAEGHTCAPMGQFLALAEDRLSIPSSRVQERIREGSAKGDLVLFIPSNGAELHIALKRLFSLEQSLASNFRRLMSHACRLRSVDASRAILWAEEKLRLHFADKQKEAIATALHSKITILTGGPGTGKSTITRAIVTILGKLTHEILTVAPTGRAAKRLQELTGHYSQTIHRLLQFNPGNGTFHHNKTNPIRCDLLIIDEASMLDTFLASCLFDAVPNHARVLLVGDVDQLPSIGPGSVLKDLINSAAIPTVRLDEIFRQARQSKIIENAHRINRGQMPFLKNDRGDFFFFSAPEPRDVRTCLLDLVTKRIPEKFGFDPRKEIQVIVPMKRGECGIEQINHDLQSYFSGKKPPFGTFIANDKVIQMKNNYQKEIFNGDIGFVQSVDDRTGEICVQFDDAQVVYQQTDRDELALAWAVSVHKYQGSECPCIVIPVHTQHFKLLNRNLLYTAITRGKRLVILVGSTKAVAIAVHQESAEQRWTALLSAMKTVFPLPETV